MSRPEEERIKEFLKKEGGKEGAVGEQRGEKVSRWRMISQSRQFQFRYNQFMRFKNESLPMLLFVCFSTYMIYKMECNLDEMRQKVLNTKTLKQLEIEKEDEYIRSMLNQNSQA